MAYHYCPAAEIYGDYSSIDDAKDACSDDSCCSAVYDEHCDNKKSLKLCKTDKSIIKTSVNHCVHKKVNYLPGKYSSGYFT